MPRRLSVGDREARADRECGELIDRVAPGAPVRQLIFIEALRHTRIPFSGYRLDHRARIKDQARIAPEKAIVMDQAVSLTGLLQWPAGPRPARRTST